MQRAVTILSAVLVTLAALGCSQRHVWHWHELQVGMDKRTVGRLLGTPTAKMGPVTKAAKTPQELFAYTLFWGEVFDREGWVYNRPGIFAGLDNLFGPSVDAHVVYFDDAGRVQGWREPLTEGDPRPGAAKHAFWRRYRQLVCAADGAAVPVESAFSQSFLPAADSAPVPVRGTCGERGTCQFEWDPASDHQRQQKAEYWVQIGLSGGESPATAPVHEWEPLTFATPRTTMHLDFGFRPVPAPIAWWRVRAVDGTTASEWSPWQRVEMFNDGADTREP